MIIEIKKVLFTQSNYFPARYVMDIKVPKMEEKYAESQPKNGKKSTKKSKKSAKIGWNLSKLVPANFWETHVRS
jgi:hypothetical protein